MSRPLRLLLVLRVVACRTWTICVCSTLLILAAGTPTIGRDGASVSETTPVLARPSRAGIFVSAIGRQAAILGYEHRSLEVWTWPFKVLDDLDVAFSIEGYPLPFAARDVLSNVTVRPHATTLTYSHAAFTIDQTLIVPVEEPAVIVRFTVRSVLPVTMTAQFRPRLRWMWPATSMTPNVSWDAARQTYELSEESGRLAAIVGAPGARDLGVMPYQEEPRDVPVRFAFDIPRESDASAATAAIVIAGSVKGREEARRTYERVRDNATALEHAAATHYATLLGSTLAIDTPDDRLDRAFDWARIGIDKGLAVNPMLGTGLLAGYRASGDSERPGFAWFFGRDALWTALATTSYGAVDTTRTALEFLGRHQRADGKIPHEVSQSASIIPWFTDFPYAWASADATPLFVIAHADLWNASGDRAFLDAHWPEVVKAYEFSKQTDRDGNALIENTEVGHGWIEGGALHPAHEEIYLQGLWIQAQRELAALAELRGERALATAAREGAERTRAAVERTYWLETAGYYSHATRTPTKTPAVAEPGPSRPQRQKRLDVLVAATRFEEDTILPAVPLWWKLLDPVRAEQQLDRLGAAALATDWGARILSNESLLYDPLSYHYGSVWPLFSGWASIGAYRHGRPHVGYQALMASALLTETGALGSVTELLSGDFHAPFGRSSHHQVWSQAMVAAPLVRGLLGLEVAQGATRITCAPHLPGGWERVTVRNMRTGPARLEWRLWREKRTGSSAVFGIAVQAQEGPRRLPMAIHLAPALPLDARVRRVTIDGRPVPFDVERVGDTQRVSVTIDTPTLPLTALVEHEGGTEVSLDIEAPEPGAENTGLRLLRVRPSAQALQLLVEGRAGLEYQLVVHGPTGVSEVPGVRVTPRPARGQTMRIRLDGPNGRYVRTSLDLPWTK